LKKFSVAVALVNSFADYTHLYICIEVALRRRRPSSDLVNVSRTLISRCPLRLGTQTRPVSRPVNTGVILDTVFTGRVGNPC